MELESLTVSALLPATPERIYHAWIDAAEHSAFTGGDATVEPVIGGRHTAWDGYIEGRILDLEPGRRIVQSWRSSDFPAESPDSQLEIILELEGDKTKITLIHSGIPVGQGKSYEEGWVEHYFVPMQRHFADPPVAKVKAAAKSAPRSAPSATTKSAAATTNAAAATKKAPAKASPSAKAKPKAQPKKAAKVAAKSAKKKTAATKKPAKKKAAATRKPVKKAPKAKAAPKAAPKAAMKAAGKAIKKTSKKPHQKAKPKAAKKAAPKKSKVARGRSARR